MPDLQKLKVVFVSSEINTGPPIITVREQKEEMYSYIHGKRLSRNEGECLKILESEAVKYQFWAESGSRNLAGMPRGRPWQRRRWLATSVADLLTVRVKQEALFSRVISLFFAPILLAFVWGSRSSSWALTGVVAGLYRHKTNRYALYR